ncbi:5-guanidino-2-oxopentanoate decarboxylase [Dongia sp.]|uniref:5-guanidino-2-oxopentanoate decarboxylase n=1 Tax=Dongia sp. TaxID=1977262 RepID=UPI0035AE0E03
MSTNQKANQIGGHAAVALLETYGVDTVFGIPGVHTLDLYRGLAERKMRHIGVRHEQGAGFMADGYARASGKPGVACLITGPGLMNAATPIGQAYSDSVPVLVMCSVNATGDLGKGRGRLHEITDQRAAIAPLTGFARTVKNAAELPGAVADAFKLFETGRPRPVVLEFPLDMLAATADVGQPKRQRAARPQASAADIATAVSLIDAAKAPILIVGGGTVDYAAEVKAFVEKSGMLCVTTTAGKGVLPDSHPQSLGSTLVLPTMQKLLADADLVVAAGTELSETDSWVDMLTFNGKLIRIDLDAATIGRDYTPALGLLADAGPTLKALTAGIKAGRKPDLATAAEMRTAARGNLSPLQRKHAKVLDALRAALPEDAIIVTDMTQIAYTANFMFPCERPRCWFHPCGFGTLGYALPAAIGAKIACPDRPVIAVAGDGGFMFTVQDLGTAVEQNLSLPVLVWNNDAFGQIAKDMVELDIPELGVKPRNPDYQALAKSFHARAVRPQSLAEMQEAIKAALKADGPTLIEVHEGADYLK